MDYHERIRRKFRWLFFRGSLMGGCYGLTEYILPKLVYSTEYRYGEDCSSYLYEDVKDSEYEGWWIRECYSPHGDIIIGGNIKIFKLLRKNGFICDMVDWTPAIYWAEKLGHVKMAKYFEELNDEQTNNK